MWILKEKRSKKEKVIIVVDLIESFKTKLKAVPLCVMLKSTNTNQTFFRQTIIPESFIRNDIPI